jgi:hypothetical protein
VQRIHSASRPPPARDVAQYSATWHCGLSSPWHYATGATRALHGAWCTRREPPYHPHACAGPLSHALKNHLHLPAHEHGCHLRDVCIVVTSRSEREVLLTLIFRRPVGRHCLLRPVGHHAALAALLPPTQSSPRLRHIWARLFKLAL